MDNINAQNDRYLPIANINRIMKKALPENAKIAKEAKEMVQVCVSEFISFITSEASDKCKKEKRKTISGEDLLYAMNLLGFENYIDILKTYLQKYRNANKILENESHQSHKQSIKPQPCQENQKFEFQYQQQFKDEVYLPEFNDEFKQEEDEDEDDSFRQNQQYLQDQQDDDFNGEKNTNFDQDYSLSQQLKVENSNNQNSLKFNIY